jgi:flavodoxin
MKELAKGLCFLSLLIMTHLLAGCHNMSKASPNGDVPEIIEIKGEEKILIAYFSWSGNTRIIAGEINRQTGGDLLEIIPAEPYPQDFDKTAERWHRERDADARPPITTIVEDIDAYQTIFVGYPIWSSNLPAVVRTFLDQYDLSGKTVIPFCTHGGSGFGRSLDTLKRLCPGAVVIRGFETYGTRAAEAGEEISKWLREIGLGKIETVAAIKQGGIIE